MPAIFTKGDLLHAPAIHAFAHTCDVTGAMSAGISLAFAKRWPEMAEDFRRRAAERAPQLGEVVVWRGGGDTVFSLVIQASADKPAKTSALDRAVAAMLAEAESSSVDPVAVGRLGAGAAKLDWQRVKRVLTDRAGASTVTLQVFEQFIRATPSPDQA